VATAGWHRAGHLPPVDPPARRPGRCGLIGEENGGSTFTSPAHPARGNLAAASEATLSKVLIIAQRVADGSFLREQLIRQGFEVQVLGIEETPQWKSKLLDAPRVPSSLMHALPSWAGIAAALKENPATQDIRCCSVPWNRTAMAGQCWRWNALTKPLHRGAGPGPAALWPDRG